MSIIWWTAERTTAHLRKIQQYHGEGAEPTDEWEGSTVRQVFQRTQLRSPTAKMIVDAIEACRDKNLVMACVKNSPRVILDGRGPVDIVFGPEDPKEFSDVSNVHGLVFINLGIQTWLASGSLPERWPGVVPLFHELGHAKQCFTDPTGYQRLIASDNQDSIEERTEYVAKAGPQKGKTLTKVVRTSLYKKLGYSYNLENDNIAKHEAPLCDDLGVGKRADYADLTGSRKEALRRILKRSSTLPVDASRLEAEVTAVLPSGKVTLALILRLTSAFDDAPDSKEPGIALRRLLSDSKLENWEQDAWSYYLDWNACVYKDE